MCMFVLHRVASGNIPIQYIYRYIADTQLRSVEEPLMWSSVIG